MSCWCTCSGGGGVGYCQQTAHPEPQRFRIVGTTMGADFKSTIRLIAEGGPWDRTTAYLEYPSPSDSYRWCQSRIGRVVTLQEIYAAVPE